MNTREMPPLSDDPCNSRVSTSVRQSSSIPPTTLAPTPAQRTRSVFWGLTYSAAALFMGTLGCGLALLAPTDLLSWRLGSNPQTTETSPQRRSILAQGLLPYRLSRPVNVVLMGIDRVPDAEPGSPESFSSRSDTLMVARLDPETETITLLSVPRDTQVEVPGYGLTKINHANWFGGPQLVRDVIAHNFNGLDLDRYVRIDTGAFRALVDLVGGLEVTVPEDMYYEDQTQGLYIDLKAGRQVLNGDQAEQFARFRHDAYGDIGRVQRQQMLLKALQQKMTQPQMVTKVPQLLEVFQDYVDTNLTLEEMAALASFGLQQDATAVKMVLLPGRASSPDEFVASYWLMDEAARDRILAADFNQAPLYANNGFAPMTETHDGDSWEQSVATDMPQGSGFESGFESGADPDFDRSAFYGLHIAVQNASGTYGQGYAMADYLRELGFWNVYVMEDWLTVEAQTQVIAQQGDVQAAQGVQGLLGLGAIEASSTGAIDSELTLRLGRDSLELVTP